MTSQLQNQARSFTVQVQLPKKRSSSVDPAEIQTVSVTESTTFDQFKKLVCPHLDPNRCGFKFGETASSLVSARDDELLWKVIEQEKEKRKKQNLKKGNEDPGGVVNDDEAVVWVVKDLGPQISYRSVFYIEYGAPIFLMAGAMFLRPRFLYGSSSNGGAEGNDSLFPALSPHQKLWGSLFIAHYVKRELETKFVHKFSKPTMPLRNVFKNSAYYWLFAAWISYALCSPRYVPPAHLQNQETHHSNAINTLFVGLWLCCQCANGLVHYQLANLRPGSDLDKTRPVPKSILGFQGLRVACPNYTFEIAGWALFSAATGLVSSGVFTTFGAVQMAIWAKEKLANYKKTDPEAVRGVKALFPFLY